MIDFLVAVTFTSGRERLFRCRALDWDAAMAFGRAQVAHSIAARRVSMIAVKTLAMVEAGHFSRAA